MRISCDAFSRTLRVNQFYRRNRGERLTDSYDSQSRNQEAQKKGNNIVTYRYISNNRISTDILLYLSIRNSKGCLKPVFDNSLLQWRKQLRSLITIRKDIVRDGLNGVSSMNCVPKTTSFKSVCFSSRIRERLYLVCSIYAENRGFKCKNYSSVG